MIKTSRYERHESLEGFGSKNQQKLWNSKVLVVGLGGLGIPVVQYLNAMGIGTLGLVENDIVALHNLQRQVLYTEKDIDKPKLKVALEYLKKQNSSTLLKSFSYYLTKENALNTIKDFDVVVDATDNFATRYLINDACVILKKPIIYGALHAFEGQVSVFNYQNGPTYRCLFPDMPSVAEIPNCDVNGVLGVLPGIIGTFQALEVIKVITGIGEVLSGKLLLFDGLTQSTQKIGFKSRKEYKNIRNLKDDYGSSFCELENSIAAEELTLLLTKRTVQLIDVRNPEEFEQYHLPGAINLPLSSLVKNNGVIDFAKNVYLVCKSGQRSAQARQLLLKQEPKATIYSLLGGIDKMPQVCQ